MIKVGITGSLASGKSTVGKIISSGKYPLFDADKIVKKIYRTNIFKKKVYKKFKLKSNKNIKNNLKNLILSNKRSLLELEKIIHPLVRKKNQNIQFKKSEERFVNF